ncbi:hypothetical protein CRG98_029911 [Punica granatum]|uniref:Uncharacterized protein n=1 Tax=Punica granatum TaxID=22663 RepID=A0A2I0J1U1_PUNGR|nr:hypothetical protein CRG98_029911 [Punica granatum]
MPVGFRPFSSGCREATAFVTRMGISIQNWFPLGRLNGIEEPIGDRVGIDNLATSLGDPLFTQCVAPKGVFDLASSILLSLELAKAKYSKYSTSECIVSCLRRGVMSAAPLYVGPYFVRTDFLESLTFVHSEAELRVLHPCIIALGNQWPRLSWYLLWKRPGLNANDRERSNVACWSDPLWRPRGELQPRRPQCTLLVEIALARTTTEDALVFVRDTFVPSPFLVKVYGRRLERSSRKGACATILGRARGTGSPEDRWVPLVHSSPCHGGSVNAAGGLPAKVGTTRLSCGVGGWDEQPLVTARLAMERSKPRVVYPRRWARLAYHAGHGSCCANIEIDRIHAMHEFSKANVVASI